MAYTSPFITVNTELFRCGWRSRILLREDLRKLHIRSKYPQKTRPKNSPLLGSRPRESASAYDVLQASYRPKPSFEMVLALLSLPASLAPILGFALSVPALVLARRHNARLAMVLASVGMVLSLAVLTFNMVYYVRHAEGSVQMTLNSTGRYIPAYFTESGVVKQPTSAV